MENTGDEGAGTLRQAILDSNASVGVMDTIEFNIPGDGPHTIQPVSALPTVTDPADINGYSQPGSSANSNALDQGLNTVLQIELDGTNVGADIDGIRIGGGGSGSTVRGLAINRFTRYGIFLDNSSSNSIQGNFLGTDPAGQTSLPNAADGLQLQSGANNLIGGSTPEAANLVSGNTLNGLVIVAGITEGTRIYGNLIGTDASGMQALGNGFAGVLFADTDGNFVGGPNPGEGNLISGNQTHGVYCVASGSNTTIQGNRIGTDRTGAGPLGNLENGVLIEQSARITVGGFGTGGNTIAFNGAHGISNNFTSVFSMFLSNSIFGNVGLGIDLLGDGPTANVDQTGVFGVTNMQNYPVLTSMTDLGTGTRIDGSLSSRTDSDYRIEFFANAEADPSGFGEGQTYLGSVDVHTDFSGVATFSADVDPLPPGQELITATATDMTVRPPRTDPDYITSEFSVVLGGGPGGSLEVTNTNDSGPGSLRDAIASANNMGGQQTLEFAIPPDDPRHFYYPDDGVAGQVTPASAATTTQADDASIAGIDPDWPHSWYSIAPESPLPIAVEPVVIDGYTQSGAVENTNPVGQGLNNILRIEIAGVNAGRADDGFLRFGGGNSMLRGININRADGPGIQLETAGGNRVEGCYLGPDISGSFRFPRPPGGITLIPRPSIGVSSAGNMIGGTDASSRNLVSGNSLDVGIGIGSLTLVTGANGNFVQANLVGTDRTGTQSLPNFAFGISIQNAADNEIGGEGVGNVISGNAGISVADSGILVRGDTPGNLISHNLIGLDAGGANPLPNAAAGIAIEGSGTTVARNFIAHNSVGISVESGAGNTFTENSIFNHSGLGIDLEAGLDPELEGINLPQDDDDLDAGPNNQQNFPTFTDVSSNGGGITALGQLSSSPNSAFTIEFFVSEETHLSGFGEGQMFLGSTVVNTDGNGDANFSANLPAAPVGFEYISCTATNAQGDTSEFSGSFPVEGCSFEVSNINNEGVGSLRQAIFCANAIAGVDTITFAIPGGGPHTIQLADALPNVLDPVVIDGYSQPGSSANTNPIGSPLNTVIQVQIDGANVPDFFNGIDILSGNSIVRGLSITHFSDGFEAVALRVRENGGNVIAGNFLGLGPDGSEGPNNFGVFIDRTPDNRIGGPDPADRNVISGNIDSGIETDGGGSSLAASDTLIQGNIIGADPTGTQARGNGLGIFARGDNATIRDNLIAFNQDSGVIVPGESPGRPASRQVAALGNSIFSNGGLGIDLVGDGVTLNDAGDPPDQDTDSNNLQNFPELTSRNDAATTTVMGMLRSLPDTAFRIEFFSNEVTDLTGFGEGQTFLGFLDVATDAGGNAPLSFDAGVPVSSDHSITATATRKDQSGTPIETSEFSARIGGPDTCSTVVTNTNDAGPGSLREAILCANFNVGLDTIGFDIPGNGPHTIQLQSGLPGIFDAVIIDGYTQPGASPNTDPNGFDGNLLIELDGSQTPIGTNGLFVASSGSTIRGLVINGFIGEIDPTGQLVFGGAGVDLEVSGGNIVQGNWIGVDVTGGESRPNSFGVGVTFVEAGAPNRIGGTEPQHRNVISGNEYSGILLQENNSIGSIVEGNFIGTDKSGRQVLGNGESGIFVNSDSSNVIGGIEPGAGNVISGNTLAGLDIGGASSTQNLIQGNFIGTDLTRTRDLGNSFGGVTVYDNASGNSILSNSIGFNAELGIDLGYDGITGNDVPPASDPPDQDTGPNNLQNYPLLSIVGAKGVTTNIQGSLASTPNTQFRIEFFSNPICDASGTGEGLRFLGSTDVTTDAQGNATIATILSEPVFAGEFLTSTATVIEGPSDFGDTSEFSECLPIEVDTGPTPTPVPMGPPECPDFDFDESGFIGPEDLLTLFGGLQSTDLMFDISGDGEVNEEDLLLFGACWHLMINN